MVKQRFKQLLLEKSAREGRTVTQKEVSEATGLTEAVLTQWAKGRVKQAQFETIEKLCKYFDCGVEDLISFDPEQKAYYMEAAPIPA